MTKASDHENRFADWLRMARAYAQLDQSEVAEQLGVTRQTYGMWERGSTVPNRLMMDATLDRLAAMSGLPRPSLEMDVRELMAAA